uniref:Uncharacterized protein n=1 Tax=Anguilla anguilla TaxID=7936 RepID=A0A0E9SEW3_ANGAN
MMKQKPCITVFKRNPIHLVNGPLTITHSLCSTFKSNHNHVHNHVHAYTHYCCQVIRN